MINEKYRIGVDTDFVTTTTNPPIKQYAPKRSNLINIFPSQNQVDKICLKHILLKYISNRKDIYMKGRIPSI